jgi:site-specific recombinase XerD
MTRRTVPGWPGNVHRQKNGLDLFIIERKVRGRRYHVSTGAHTLTAALKQLERFEASPAEYDPRGGDGERLELTAKLIDEWKAHQLAKGNTRVYVRDQARKMGAWLLKLNSADLRKLTLRHLREGLQGLSARKHRIIAIKSFFAWLRTEKGLITTAQDATLDLKVPQASPEKHRRRKVVPWQDVEAVLAHLTATAAAEAWRPRARDDRLEPGEDLRRRRDCLLLLTATGWHVTELQRFIRGGELLRQASGDVLAVLVVRHKGGELARTPIVHREHLEAAERLRAAGKAPRNLEKQHRAACLAADVPVFGLGVMRHSVATWAVEAGATPEAVARFLGHKDSRTTKRFYVDVAVPTNVIPLRRIH